MKEIYFKYGDVFKKGDALSQWIFMLTAVQNDINVVLTNLLNEGKKETSRDMMYYFRLSTSHFKESVRLVQWGTTQFEVQKFIQTLNEKSRAKLIDLKKLYDPFEDSFIEKYAKPIRDNFFHYTDHGNAKQSAIDKFIEENFDKQTSIYFGSGKNGEMRTHSSTEFLLHLSLGNLEEPELTEIMLKLRDGLLNLKEFIDDAIAEYLNQSLPEEVKNQIKMMNAN